MHICILYIKLCIHTFITLHCIAFHYITLYYITLHYITLHDITLHYMTLHYITYIHIYIYMDRVSHISIYTYTYYIYTLCTFYFIYIYDYICVYSIPYTYVSAGPEFMLSLLSFRPPKPPGPPERARAQGHPGRHRSPEPRKSCPAGWVAGLAAGVKGWSRHLQNGLNGAAINSINPLNCNIRAVPRLSQRQVKASRETK